MPLLIVKPVRTTLVGGLRARLPGWVCCIATSNSTTSSSPAFRDLRPCVPCSAILASHTVDSGRHGRQYMIGNTMTAPPEVIYGGCEYTDMGDVYSLGSCMSSLCLLETGREMLGGSGPYYSKVLDRAIWAMMDERPMKRPLMWEFAMGMREMMSEGCEWARRVGGGGRARGRMR